MEKQRILHISKYYPPHTGGIEYVCHSIVSSQSEFLHSVICFSGTHQTSVDQFEGVKIVRVKSFAKVASQSLSLSYFFRLRQEIKTFKPHIIHFHAPNPLVGLYLLALIPKQVKLIVHYHAEILTSAILYTCYRPFEKALFRRADKIIATSPKLRDEALPLSLYRHKCEVVENTITTSDLDLRPGDECAVAALKLKYNNSPIVLAFGRHVPYKGLNYLIDAEQSIRSQCEIVVGGVGPQTQFLQKLSHSDRLHFVGRIPNDQLRIYLHAATVFAFPSTTRAEAFGLTLVQAMYCATPPVTFTIPASGVNYVNINGVTGIEVANGDACCFAAAIDNILSDDMLREKFIKSGQERVAEYFTIANQTQKMRHIYEKLLYSKHLDSL